ncbi:Rib/alpha-like domain-containing protein, partial [Staphylococcus aureus]|nr:Rib/alpha-like domain-containing protein [Staphylococcus aureus]
PVTTGKKPAATATKYEPTSDVVRKPYGVPTTEGDVTGAVTVPNYPTTGEQPVVTVDDPESLPNGENPGTYYVPVTVTYPDGSQDHIT